MPLLWEQDNYGASDPGALEDSVLNLCAPFASSKVNAGTQVSARVHRIAMRAVLLAALAVALAVWTGFRRAARAFATGAEFRLPGTRFRLRRWTFPRDLAESAKIQLALRAVSEQAVGQVLDYPALTDPAQLFNRCVLILYDASAGMRPVAFHLPLLAEPLVGQGTPGRPIYHIGLIMVDPQFRGRGLQVCWSPAAPRYDTDNPSAHPPPPCSAGSSC